MTTRTDVVALVAALSAFVDARIAERLGANDATYASDGPLPPRTSRRTFADRCRSGAVLGAEREGKIWRCTREAWHAARSRRPTRAAAPANDDALADAYLAAAGIRATRSA